MEFEIAWSGNPEETVTFKGTPEKMPMDHYIEQGHEFGKWLSDNSNEGFAMAVCYELWEGRAQVQQAAANALMKILGREAISEAERIISEPEEDGK